jgi:phosphatidylglycerophosphate synthase
VTTTSCIRLVGAPVFILLFISPVEWARLLGGPFIVGLFLTDLLDGFLARRWNVTSDIGYVLDGVADRSAHIAVAIALTVTNEISPVLAFFLIMRDLLLYAARAVFDDWWAVNTVFRIRVKITAVVFKGTIGAVAMLAYFRTVRPEFFSESETQQIHTVLICLSWIFVLWTYVLLAQQVRRYAMSTTLPVRNS